MAMGMPYGLQARPPAGCSMGANARPLRFASGPPPRLCPLPIPQAMLKEGHKHLSGLEEAVLKNIEACKSLAQITRTSMGPNGGCWGGSEGLGGPGSHCRAAPRPWRPLRQQRRLNRRHRRRRAAVPPRYCSF